MIVPKVDKYSMPRVFELYEEVYDEFIERIALEEHNSSQRARNEDEISDKVVNAVGSVSVLNEIAKIEPVLSALAEAEFQFNISSIGKIHTIPSALRSLLGVPVKAAISPTSTLSVSASVQKDALKKDVYEVEDMQLNISAGLALALYAVRTARTGDDSYTITTFRGPINLKDKLPKEFIDLIQTYRSEIDSSTLFKEFTFTIIHEMLHIRLNHLVASSVYEKNHRFSRVLSNIVLDLYINTLILTFNKYLASVNPKAVWTANGISGDISVRNFIQKVSDKSPKNEYTNRLEYLYASLPMYRNTIRMHLSEDIEKEEITEARELWEKILPYYGTEDVNPEELIFGNSIDNLVIDNLYNRSDDELVILIDNMFGPLFDIIDEVTSEAIDKTLEELEISEEILAEAYGTPYFHVLYDVLNKKYREIFSNLMKERVNKRKNLKKLIIDAITTIGLPEPNFPIGSGTGSSNGSGGGSNSKDQNNADSASAKAEASRGEQTVREIIDEHEKDINRETGKNAGSVPGFLRKLTVRKSKKPSFIELLRKIGEKGGIGGYTPTFAPPNRKFMGTRMSKDMLHPSYATKAPNVAVIVDTSGSMYEDDLGKFIGVMKHVMRAFPQATFTFYWNDADYDVTKYFGNQFSKFESDIKKKGIHGGGGSVFDNVFNDRSIVRNSNLIVFVSDFYIFVEPNKVITRKLPLVMIPTPNYDEGVLKKFSKSFRYSLVLPMSNL